MLIPIEILIYGHGQSQSSSIGTDTAGSLQWFANWYITGLPYMPEIDPGLTDEERYGSWWKLKSEWYHGLYGSCHPVRR